MRNWRAKTAAIVAVSALALTACGSDDSEESGSDGSTGSADGGNANLSGDIAIDGSSTVAPLSEAAAQLFMAENGDVRISVGTSGTGGGFEKFCAGENDLSDASREIKDEEIALCEDGGITYEAIQVANDALSVIVNPNNPIECVTVEQLSAIWTADSEVSTWGDVEGLDSGDLADSDVSLYGPGTDSGTFDYFTDEINGEEGVIRSDYTDIGEDDQAAIIGVEGEEAAMAFVPYSFAQQAGDAVKSLQIDSGEGCVDPTQENVQSGTYTPLARPLFVYASDTALAKPEVLAFMQYYLDNSTAVAEAVTMVPMTQEQIDAGHAQLDALAGA